MMPIFAIYSDRYVTFLRVYTKIFIVVSVWQYIRRTLAEQKIQEHSKILLSAIFLSSKPLSILPKRVLFVTTVSEICPSCSWTSWAWTWARAIHERFHIQSRAQKGQIRSRCQRERSLCCRSQQVHNKRRPGETFPHCMHLPPTWQRLLTM